MARLTDIEGVHKGTSYSVNSPDKIQVLKGFNARKKFRGIPELAQRIDTAGLLNPLWVRRDRANEEQPFILIDGERRLRALHNLFEKNPKREEYIPVIIFDVDEEGAEDLMAQANLDRDDFTLSERIGLVERYLKRKLSVEEVAERLQRSEPWVHQLITLKGASAKLRKAVDEGQLSMQAALMIARKKKLADQEAALKQVVALAGGKKERTARAAAQVTKTAVRPKKSELLKVVGALENKVIEADQIEPEAARKLVLIALSFAAGEADRNALLEACAAALKLAKVPEEEEEEAEEGGGQDPEPIVDPIEAEEARQAAPSKKKTKGKKTPPGAAAASLLDDDEQD